MNFEILGIIASLFVLLSFIFSSEIKIRLVNIVGAFLFVVYGIFINAFSIWFLNLIFIGIHLIKLFRRRNGNNK